MDSSTEVNPCLSQSSISGGSGGNGNNQQQPFSSSSMLMQYQKFNFVSGIDALLVKEKDSIVDLIAVLRSQGELISFVSKASQRQMQKRELVLVDQSMYQVKLTLFGKQAETFDQNAAQGSVLVLKSCKVSEYNGGKSLTLLSSGSMFVNPDIQQAHLLRGWYESEGSMQNFTSLDGTVGGVGALGGRGMDAAAAAGLRNYGCLQDIQEKNLGLRDKPDYLNLCGTVTFLKGDKTMYYLACPGENCNKKVTEDMGQYRCEKCQRVYNYCDYRYIFSFQLTDYSSSSWVQCFNEAGEILLGMPAEELHRLKESQQDEEKYQSVFEKVAYKRFKFTIKIKQENYQV
jgi:replication factor A1